MATTRNLKCTSNGADGSLLWPSGTLTIPCDFSFGSASASPIVQLWNNGYATNFIGGANGANINVTFPSADGEIAVKALSLAYAAKTSTYAITSNDCTIDCTSGTFTVTLPTAVGITGKVFNIKNSGAGTITVATTSGQTVDGTTAPSVTPGVNLTVQSTGANWIIL